MVSHRFGHAKLGKDTAHRMAMLRNVVTSLFEHERIRTTHPRAKAAQRLADKYINIARSGDTMAARQKVNAFITVPDVVHKLFTQLGPRYVHRSSGFTRVLHAGFRAGDSAPISYFELVDRPGEMRPAKLCDETYAAQKKEQLSQHQESRRKARL